MAYTTTAIVKRSLTHNYQKPASSRLTADGWISVAGVFNEVGFLAQFVTSAGDTIDGMLAEVATPPFITTGLLTKLASIIAVYEAELYLISASSDRVVSVTLYKDYEWALKTLTKIAEGDLSAKLHTDWAAWSLLTGLPIPDLSDYTGNSPGLIEPENDGVTLTIGSLEENILQGGSRDATEIPE